MWESLLSLLYLPTWVEQSHSGKTTEQYNTSFTIVYETKWGCDCSSSWRQQGELRMFCYDNLRHVPHVSSEPESALARDQAKYGILRNAKSHDRKSLVIHRGFCTAIWIFEIFHVSLVTKILMIDSMCSFQKQYLWCKQDE